MLDDDVVKFENVCTRLGKVVKSSGIGKIVGEGKLKVFFGFASHFKNVPCINIGSNYHVVYVDLSYNNAIVSDGGENIWFLSRQSCITRNMYNSLVVIAKQRNLKNTHKMIMTIHDN